MLKSMRGAPELMADKPPRQGKTLQNDGESFRTKREQWHSQEPTSRKDQDVPDAVSVRCRQHAGGSCERGPRIPRPAAADRGREDHAAYDDLLTRISAALQPGDILEDIWVRDVVDMVWDALRLRRLKTQLLTASAYEGMHAILCRFLDWQFSEQVARQWALREQSAVTKAEAVLASAGLSSEAVTAQTLALKIDIVERIDRMMVTAEARRNSVLREIERHRASFARTLRRAVQDVEDAEAVEDAAQAEGRALTPIAATISHPRHRRERCAPARSEPRQCARQHRPEDARGQGALGRQCASSRLEPAGTARSRALARDRRAGARDRRRRGRSIFRKSGFPVFRGKCRPRNRIWSASQHTGGSTYMERAPARTASSSPAASPPRSSISCARAARASTCCGKTRCAMTCSRAASAAPAWRWSCGPSTATNAARCRGGDGPSSRLTRRRPRLRARTGRRNPPAAQLLAERTQVAKRQQSSTPAAPAVHAGGEGATSCAGSDFARAGGPA